ncbi:MAG: ABC transporter substrate-binding protein [Solirubrobacterales bacterium]
MKKIRKSLIVLMLLSLIITLGGCTSSNKGSNTLEAPGNTTYPLTITDDAGNKVTIEKEPSKIVSTAPSTTETLFALGLGSKVVGRSENDNYPADAQKIAVVGGFSGPNTELITKLAPDVVFTVKGTMSNEAKKLLEGAGIKVVIFNPQNIDGVFADIKQAGEICNVQGKAKEVTDSMNTKRQEVLSKIKDVNSKKVFVDLGSFFSAGNGSFINSMLKDLKAENIAEKSSGEWPQLTLEQVVNADPEVYISLQASLDELNKVSGIKSIKAFKDGNVKVMAPGTLENDIMQRPGPRVIDGFEIYAKTIYPEAFK